MPGTDDKTTDGTGGAPATGDGAGAPAGDAKILSMTQEQLDAIIQARVARAVPADYETLKAKAKAKDDADAASQSELEKEKTARTAAEAETARVKAENAAIKRTGSIVSAAQAAGAANPSLIAQILAADPDVTVSADGTVVGAKEAIAKLLKENPGLKGKAPVADASGSGGFNGTDLPSLDDKIRIAEAKILNAKDGQERRNAIAEAGALKAQKFAHATQG